MITAELYRKETGSSMKMIDYLNSTPHDEIKKDLLRCFDDWDYALVYDPKNDNEPLVIEKIN